MWHARAASTEAARSTSRVKLCSMSRALAVATACLLTLWWSTARADSLDASVSQLGATNSYKSRLAAALSLSKSHDARAVIALADAVEHDDDPTIRRVAALALGKMIDVRTAADARELALEALDHAASGDRDHKVRDTAKESLSGLSGLRKTPTKGSAKGPSVFVNIDTAVDQTQAKSVASDAAARLTTIVRRRVETTGYATSWPGGLPTQAQLTSSRSRAFIVASTVKKIQITHKTNQAEVGCTVTIRVAPWEGSDGGEKWEANKAASASGSAKAMTGTKDKDIQGGVRDCIEAVTEDVTTRQVVPFLKRLATAGS